MFVSEAMGTVCAVVDKNVCTCQVLGSPVISTRK